MLNDNNPESFIDRDTVAKGTLKTERNVRIDGILEGTVIAEDCVQITQVGRLHGEMQTREALVEGQVRGPMEASERLIFTETCDIESNVVAPCLNVLPGARLKGHFIITSNAEERARLKQEHFASNSKTLKKVSLSVSFADAKNVHLVGDFCEWNEKKAIPMNPSKNGKWSVEIQLRPGNYEYLFLVDGQPQSDPDNPHKTPNSYGGENSLLIVM